MLPEFFEFFHPTRVVYGIGLASDFSAELAQIPTSRFFLITDRIIRQTGMIDPIIRGIEAAGLAVVGIFDEVPPNSEVQVVTRATELARASDCDAFIAIGGGSVMDTAKAINVLFNCGGELADYEGTQTIGRPLSPFIALPTTAGTGSESTSVAVILDAERHVKIPFVDRYLLPTLAVLDPELTVSMPAHVTAATGMDALTHAIEAFVGIQSSPASDALALQAMKMVYDNLLTAVTEPRDLQARGAMLIASNLAGVAFNHSMVGIVHAMSHTCGGLHHVPHGTANAILLPHGMRYNLDAVEGRYAAIARQLQPSEFGASDDRAASVGAIALVDQLNRRLHEACGFPYRLRDVGIEAVHLPAIAAQSLDDGSCFYNPKEVTEEGVLEALKQAW